MRRPDPTPEALAVGSVIRGHRKRLGVPMAELAARSGLSQPFLSQLERGLTTPSLASIYKIAEALGLPPGIFLRPSSTSDTVAHEEDPQVIRVTEGTGQFARVLIPGGQSDVMEAYEQHFTPGQGERGWFEHTGEDFIYVLEGEVDLELRDQEPIRLRAGQSAHHRGDIPHRCRLVGDEPARTLLVVTLGR